MNKMKFYLFAFCITGLGFISCRKDRTCNCLVTTEGTSTTHSQSAGNTINIPPIPPIVITPASDTIYSNPYVNNDTEITNYHKVSKNTMYKNCPTGSEKNFTENSTNIIPGTSTVTTTNSGKKTYSCKIE